MALEFPLVVSLYASLWLFTFSFSMLFVERQFESNSGNKSFQRPVSTWSNECCVKVWKQGKNLSSNILTWNLTGIIIITLLVFNRLLFPVIALLYLLCPVRCSWRQLCSHAFRCVSRPGRRRWQQLLSFSRDPSAHFT